MPQVVGADSEIEDIARFDAIDVVIVVLLSDLWQSNARPAGSGNGKCLSLCACDLAIR
jgi:uncharacterized membrane protein